MYVRRFRGLTDLWLPWSGRSSVIGENAVGKTRLLEALARLTGSPETLRLLADSRTPPAPDTDVSVIVREFTDALPHTRKLTVGVAQLDLPQLEPVRQDAAWWAQLSPPASPTLGAVLDAVDRGARDVLEPLLDQAAERPLIRYRLTFAQDGLPSLLRTLCAPRSQIEPLRSALRAVKLPSPWGPLAQAVTRGHGQDPHVDLLRLPQRDRPPIELQWLVEPRRPAEAQADLTAAAEAALPAVAELADGIDNLLPRLGFNIPLVEGDTPRINPGWWISEVAAQAARAELAATAPTLGIYPSDDGAFLGVRARHGYLDPGEREMRGWLGLSAGERRWVDEAMATAATAVRKFGDFATAAAHAVDWMHPGDLDEGPLVDFAHLAIRVESSIAQDEYWTGPLLAELVNAFSRPVIRARLAAAAGIDSDQGWLAAALTPTAWRPDLAVRVFDEPEAHLHPAAQRRVADALETFAVPGSCDVLMASHQPRFLGRPGWTVHSLSSSPTGTTRLATLVDKQVADVAAALGLSAGELLVTKSGFLVVEGEHDRLILADQFGDELDASGVVLIRAHGTDNLPSMGELSLLTDVLWELPVAILVDNADFSAGQKEPETDEQRAIQKLLANLKNSRRVPSQIGLGRPDIVAFLAESVVQSQFSRFPGWEVAVAEFHGHGTATGFKGWLDKTYGVHLQTVAQVQRILDLMRSEGARPEPELLAKVN